MKLIRFRSKINVMFRLNKYDLLLIIINILNIKSNRYREKRCEQLFDRIKSRRVHTSILTLVIDRVINRNIQDTSNYARRRLRAR